ncbi:protein translocase subunit SecD [Candidatus Azambacteria bacterium]|nr:protein translocase subunit SecD [Candidatus Azambacteria bacterium]
MKFLVKVLKFIFVPEGERAKSLYILLFIFIVAVAAFGFDFPEKWNAYGGTWHIPKFRQLDFKLGLDLKGGAHLVYVADLSNVKPADYGDAMAGLRDVIERRVNSFGIGEPNVQTAQVGGEHRLNVELAGIKDVNQAIQMIGQTPYLEFKEGRPEEETKKIQDAQKKGERVYEDPYFIATELNGKYLKRSELTFDQNTYKPVVNLVFDSEGAALFAKITGRNVGKTVAIYLDGGPISVPRVNEAITGGSAIITGDFSVQEAKQLVQRLNSGALPVPVKLISQQTVEASLGEEALKKSFQTGIWALGAVAVFMVLWYKIPGMLAIIALLGYALFTLAAFKLLGVTLTLAGIVGFILSIGMAVDANILIFARMREEFRAGKRSDLAVHDAFLRAWPSIRDSNISTLLTCFVLYFFTASLIKGFALTLAIGVLISMFSAIFVTRALLRAVIFEKLSKLKFLWYR